MADEITFQQRVKLDLEKAHIIHSVSFKRLSSGMMYRSGVLKRMLSSIGSGNTDIKKQEA